MKSTNKLAVASVIVLFSMILSLVFPTSVLADDATPPPPETPEVLPPTEEPVTTEESATVQVLPTEPALTEAPVDNSTPPPTETPEVLPPTEAPEVTDEPMTVDATPTESAATEVPATNIPAVSETAGDTDLAGIVGIAAENDVILADASGEPLTLGTQEASDLLAAGDPFFWNGTSWVGYIPAGGTCPTNVTCTISADPFQAAVTAAPPGTMIYVAGDADPDTPLDYGEDVTIDNANLSFRGYSGAIAVSPDGSDFAFTAGYAITTSFTLNALFGTTSGVFGKTVYVNETSAGTATIQDGIDLVAPGATALQPGTVVVNKLDNNRVYSEQLVINKANIALTGDPGVTTLPGPGPDAPTLDGSGVSGDTGITVYGEGLTLSGFIIQNFDTAVYQETVSGKNTITYDNNLFTNNVDGIKVVKAGGSPGIEVHQNAFVNNTGFDIINTDPSPSNNLQNINATYNYWGCTQGPVVAFLDATNDMDYIVWRERNGHGGPLDPYIYQDNPYPGCALLYGDSDSAHDSSQYGHGGSNYSPYKIIIDFLATPGCEDPNALNYGAEGACQYPPADNVPVANDDTASTAEDTLLSGNVAGNDVQSGDGAHTWNLLGGVSHGTLTFNADGSYSYMPAPNYNGADSFTYEICDADSDCDPATVNITVSPVDDVPVANDDANSTNEDTPVSGSVVGNDVPSGDGGNIWTKLSDAAHGTVTFEANGNYTYTPAADWNGTDSFTYQLCDADGDCSTATVTITVNPVDDAPVAVDDTNSTNEDTPVSGSVTGNDLQSGDGGNTWSKVSDPANGDVVFNGDGTYTYTPNANWNGTDSFDYQLCDADGDCSSATVTIIVGSLPDAPVANDDANSTSEDTPVSGSVTGNDLPSGDGGNVWSKVSDPANGTLTFDASGNYTYTPNANWSGTDSFTYQLCDIDTDCDPATVTIMVSPVDDLPVALDDTNSTNEDTPVSGSVAGNDKPSGDGGNVWSKVNDPANGAVVLDASGNYTYTPNANWNGTDSFTYQLCDTDGDCSTATVRITVIPVDDAPVALDDANITNEDTPVSGSVAGNDTLSGDGGNTWSKLTDPTNGTVSLDGSGNYIYTPNANWNGTDIFTYQLCDGDGDCSNATVTITVGPVDDFPVANDDANSTNENVPVNGNVAGNDVLSGDGGNVWIKLSDPINGAVTFDASGNYTYTPNANWNGTDSFDYQLCDGDNDCDPATVTISVGSVNDVPVAANDANSTNEDTAVSGSVVGNDTQSSDGGNVWSKLSDPANGTVTFDASGNYTYTPNVNWNGTDSFTYQLCDIDAECSTATVTITVYPVDDAPLAVNDTNSTNEDTPVIGSVIGNDVPSGDGGNVWSKLSDPANGIVTFDASGNYTYTPNLNWNGIDTFSYQLCDVDGDCSSATVSIMVSPVDDVPLANDDINGTNEDTPVSGSVIGNDLQSGDGGNTWSKLGDPANGTVTFDTGGNYTYSPNVNWNGIDIFTYQLCDGDGDCSTATVTITVNPVDDAPLAIDDTNSTNEDTPVSGSVAGNDTPSGDGGNIWSKTGDPTNGNVVFNANGNYIYTPNANWNGIDSFTYQVCDVDNDCATATVTITVDPVDDTPVANDDINSTNEDTPVSGSVTGNDLQSGDGGNIWSKVSDPAHGTVTVNLDGSYTYTPDANWNGTDSFVYRLCDADNDCSTAAVTIIVGSLPDVPVANDDANSTNEDTPVSGSVIGNDLPSGDGGNVWTKITNPANGTVTFGLSGNYTYTPNANWNGTDSFTYQICDVDNDCDPATVTITVNAVDDFPMANDDTNNTNEDVSVSGSVVGNDIQSGDGGNVWSKVSDPANGTVTFDANGNYTYTPNANSNGMDSFTYELCDVDGDCSTATVTITVRSLPDAVNDNDSTNEGVAVTTNVLTNDDLGEPATVIIDNTNGSHGTVTCTDTNCTYTPNAGFTGTDSYTYIIMDSNEHTSTATVTVTVVKPQIPGCTNPTALNYNKLATVDDGSCIYSTPTPRVPSTSFSGLVPVTGEAHAIAAGIAHTCAITPEGGVKCWGNNDFGQLGDGTNTGSNVPVNVPGLQAAKSIVAGGNHTCALTGDEVWCWGQNSQGQLGDGTTTDRNVPVKALSGAVDVTAGFDYTCAVLLNGSTMCWGNNDRGQLADGTKTDHAVPTPATLLSGISRIDAGLDKSCGLTDAGLLTCAMSGSVQEIGGIVPVTGEAPETNLNVAVNRFGSLVVALTESGVPITFQSGQFKMISGVSDAIDIDSGFGHVCALLSSGTVDCWGSNSFGQLGINSTSSSSEPQAVLNLSNVSELAVGKNHACVLSVVDDQDVIQCWGLNQDGQLGDGTNVNSSIPVLVKE